MNDESFVLAIYTDGSGVWGVGASWEEACHRAADFWESLGHDPLPCTREEWLEGLRRVEVRATPEAWALLMGLESFSDLPDNVNGRNA